ncbi:MAG: hypothetical protein QOF79_2718, partial [Actinomycetota bacterium]|nr:hypothetical protein [Actinomycetota bacterium]
FVRSEKTDARSLALVEPLPTEAVPARR